MKKSSKKLLFYIVFVISATIGCIIFSQIYGVESGNKNIQKADLKHSVDESVDIKKNIGIQILNEFQNSINVFGKVVDQNGKPINGVEITMFSVTSFSQDRSNPIGRIITDSSGEFEAKSLKGSQVSFIAKKDGYIRYTPMGGPTSSVVATKSYARNSPMILTLHDPGKLENLYHVALDRISLPLDGSLKRISLSKINSPVHNIEISFDSDRRYLPMTNEGRRKRYNWKFKMRLPGGDLLKMKVIFGGAGIIN